MNEWDEFDALFQRMMRPFSGLDDAWNKMRSSGNMEAQGPIYYGYSVTVGQDGKPVVKEYGNLRPGLIPAEETREPFVDVIIDDKKKVLKVVAEMPGVEKKDIRIEVVGSSVQLDAEQGERKYHAKVPIKHKIDDNSIKATYAYGILEVRCNLNEEEKPTGLRIAVDYTAIFFW